MSKGIVSLLPGAWYIHFACYYALLIKHEILILCYGLHTIISMTIKLT